MPAMRIHVLPGKVSKVESASVSYEIVTKEGIPCPADDSVGTQVFNKWIIDVKMRIGSFVKSHEKFIVIAFRSFEDALDVYKRQGVCFRPELHRSDSVFHGRHEGY